MHKPNFFVNEETRQMFVVIHNMTVPVKFQRYSLDKDKRVLEAEKAAGSVLMQAMPLSLGAYEWSFRVKESSDSMEYRLLLQAVIPIGEWNQEVTVVINPFFPDSIHVQLPNSVQRYGNQKAGGLNKMIQAQVQEALSSLHDCFNFQRRLK